MSDVIFEQPSVTASANAAQLRPFLAPEGVALIGASKDPTKLGYTLGRNLVKSGYRGRIHFVNPGGGRLLERPVHLVVADVPDPVDLAVLLIPAPGVPEALGACGERGIRAAIIASGGFSETGAYGAELEARCLRVARAYEMRIIGPNCIGVIDTHLPLDTTFLPPPGPPRGDIALLSHSGAMCASVVDWSAGRGFGLSRLMSLGNQADVCETDLLGLVGAEDSTRVVALYLESVKDGRRFVAEARKVSSAKPVVALKVGRSAGGQRAAASHTGAMAGREEAYDAAFQRAGILRAPTTEALFDWARVLSWAPLPAGRRIAIVTNAGGPGVAAADALDVHGLQLADLSESTLASLQSQQSALSSMQVI